MIYVHFELFSIISYTVSPLASTEAVLSEDLAIKAAGDVVHEAVTGVVEVEARGRRVFVRRVAV